MVDLDDHISKVVSGETEPDGDVDLVVLGNDLALLWVGQDPL